VTLTVGYEVLGSDKGVTAFRTPLATGHKWNGWADKFLTTPAAGLEDFYIDLTYKVKDMDGSLEILNGLLTKIQYHNFSATKGDAFYGREWGVYLKKSVHKNVYVETKYAAHDANDIGTNVQKIVFGVGVKY